MQKLLFKQFRIQNYRNIDDSGWIPVEQVTALVGRNESGKTSLLKALNKFNPGTEEPYNPQREFPRDRFTREFRKGNEWPVCSVEFELTPEFRAELKKSVGIEVPSNTTCTRFYDGSLQVSYETSVHDNLVPVAELVKAIDHFARGARRLASPSPENEARTQETRASLANWATAKKETLKDVRDLKNTAGVKLLKVLREETNSLARPETADLVEELQASVDALLTRSQTASIPERLDKAIEAALPVFVYFENYGILDSAVYLPRFLEDLNRNPNDERVRTVNAMFKHVGLTAKEIADLGVETSEVARAAGQTVTAEMIAKDQARKELRAVKLNSASLDITGRFSKWFGQRRHNIRYDVDGNYFRIWVSDDRRPGIEIELESRSKGFQWFFSFYLVFLVESAEGHKDAILLLDEPGLHLHPTAQQGLIAFFDRLAADTPIIYSTHSPFLIDGEHIHRVRPVREDDTGHSRISINSWPRDRETIFPLQAAAGYAMVRGLFQHKKNVLVEGMADYLYLHTANLLCNAIGRPALPDDIYITACGGTKLMGHLASLFLGQNVRPVVLLDGDDAGRVRRDALMKELYAGQEKAVLMLSDVLGQAECEIEDMFGEAVLLPFVRGLIGKELVLSAADRTHSLPSQIRAAAERHGIELAEGWKVEVARRVAIAWSTTKPADIPVEVLDRFQKLFQVLTDRFDGLRP